MAKVRAHVFVRGEDGQSALLRPGDDVPKWATVTNPDALEPTATILPAPAAEEEAEAPASEAPAPAPEPTPAPRKRTSPKAATS